MQKIFSTRLDEATLNEMERATKKLGMSKRQFLEEAIQLRVERLGRDLEADVWSETLGAWQRRESGATTIRRARRALPAPDKARTACRAGPVREGHRDWHAAEHTEKGGTEMTDAVKYAVVIEQAGRRSPEPARNAQPRA